MAHTPSAVDLLPVAVGGDIGVYAFVRAFHEAYGCEAIVLSAVATRPMQHSSFVHNVVVPGIDDEEVLCAALERVAGQHPDRTLVLLTNTDWFVRALVANTERLGRHYLMPYCSPAVLDQVSSKEGFAEICDRLDIPTPRTVAVDLAALRSAGGRAALPGLAVDLDFPVVAKPSSSAEHHYLQMPGKRKVDHLSSRSALDDLLGRLLDAGYTGTYLIQDRIPGDETQMRSLTAYRDTRGVVTLLATGRVLLEEHTPGTLGIPAAILTEPYQDAMAAATRFLDAAGYTGFANFDYKLDPRTGQHVYFEMNPRIGRNNYYVTAAGANPARAVVADLVERRSTPVVQADREVLYAVVPFGLLLRYIAEPALRARLRTARREHRLVHPLRYAADSAPLRRLIVEGVTQVYRRKYRQYYPRPAGPEQAG
jgi:D-aspartate ligase